MSAYSAARRFLSYLMINLSTIYHYVVLKRDGKVANRFSLKPLKCFPNSVARFTVEWYASTSLMYWKPKRLFLDRFIYEKEKFLRLKNYFVIKIL